MHSTRTAIVLVEAARAAAVFAGALRRVGLVTTAALAVLLGGSLVRAQATAGAGEAEFLAELERIARMRNGRQWQEASDAYLSLVDQHAEKDYVLLHWLEIVDGVKLCMFHLTHPTPELDELISGRIVEQKKNGWVKLEYLSGGLQDFERGERYLVHPMAFERSYSIEMDFEKYSQSLAVVIGLDTDSPVQVRWGGDRRDGDADIREPEGTLVGPFASPLEDGKPAVVRLTVKSGSVAAYGNGKKIMSARRSSGVYGQIAIEGLKEASLRRLTIYGTPQPAWFGNVRDRAFYERWNEFDFREQNYFPRWFRGGASLPEELEDVALQAVEEALALLEDSRASDAKARIDRAVRDGVHPKFLGKTQRVLAKALHGPTWSRTYEYKTRHYRVRSDIDEQTCHEVAEHLEASLQRFYRDLLRPAEQDRRRYDVFVFSGEAGYQAYMEDVTGARAENSAGIYSLTLKQLLIWNSPDREDVMRTVRHEGFHQYFHTLGRVPRWLNEGMAEYYENARLVSGRWRQDEPHPDHVRVLEITGPAYLRKFVKLSDATFMSNAAVSYAQSWALVHFLRHSTRANREVFDQLIEAIDPERDEKQMMKAAQVDFRSLQREFEQHVRALRPQ